MKNQVRRGKKKHSSDKIRKNFNSNGNYFIFITTKIKVVV